MERWPIWGASNFNAPFTWNAPFFTLGSSNLDALAALVIDLRYRTSRNKEGWVMAGNGSNAGFEVLISSDSHVMEPSEILAERVLIAEHQRR